MNILSSSTSLLSGVNSPSAVLGLPFVLALVSLQVECRLPPKFVLMRAVEKSLYGGDKSYSGRLNLDQSLSRKEAYRGRRRRKRRPMANSVHSYGGYNKKARSRPRRPPPVQEYQEEFDDLGEESGYSEDRPVRTRPWSNHLYSASIRNREPPRARPDYYNRYRGGKRPRPMGNLYNSREPEDLDNRWNEFRDDFPPRNPDWDLEDPGWEPDRARNPYRDEYVRYNGKNTPWRDTREGQQLRPQGIKNVQYNVDTRDMLQNQQMPSYQVWSDDANSQDDIEVQVKYPVWMEEPKSEDWPEVLYPGQRVKQKYQSQEAGGRVGKQRPAINQDLEAHVLQPAKTKTKFRSGIGQNVRGQTKEINWELDSPYQNSKATDLNWEDPKPFENPEPQWKEPKKIFPWNPKKTGVANKEGQWEESKNVYNKDFPWGDTSSAANQEYWTDSTPSTSQVYPHWDSSQQYYHDRSLRQQAAAQAKMDMDHEEDDHDVSDSDHDHNNRKSIGTQK